MRVGISGAHGTGKTTLAEALGAQLPGHAVAGEPYDLLEEQGYEFGFPPSPEDFRALLACSVRSLTAARPNVIFDRTPLDYLAYPAETERVLPAADEPALRERMNEALLKLVYDDPVEAWADVPVLELTGALGHRLDAVLAALR